jgi:hypothetical protein
MIGLRRCPTNPKRSEAVRRTGGTASLRFGFVPQKRLLNGKALCVRAWPGPRRGRSAPGVRGFEAPSLRPAGEVTADRFRDRLELRRLVAGGGPPAAGWDRFDQRAVDIITSGRGAEAFDISRESEETKKLYGVRAQGDDMGKLTLQARRLIEAGVRFVTVGRDSWDHHEKIFPALRSRLPKFDDAFSGLVIDLERRGLHVRASDGRPMMFVDEAKPVAELLA